MPFWQSGMRWISDAVADGPWWKRLVVYGLLAVVLATALGLLVLAVADDRSAEGLQVLARSGRPIG